jgi:hypothetical protein
MSKINRNISVFSLWLAWMVFTAHLIIPHDHHLADSFTTKEDICPGSNGKTGHKSGFPIHCHAFNDLVSEKVVKYVLNRNIQFSDISVCSFSDGFELQNFCITFFDLRKTFQDSQYLKLSALRGPPSLS